MLTSTKSLENHETDQKRCILSRKVYLMAIGQGFHGKPSPTLGSLPAGLNAENRESTCLHIYAVVYVTVIRLAHAIVNLSTSTFMFTIMAEMIFAQETWKS